MLISLNVETHSSFIWVEDVLYADSFVIVWIKQPLSIFLLLVTSKNKCLSFFLQMERYLKKKSVSPCGELFQQKKP